MSRRKILLILISLWLHTTMCFAQWSPSGTLPVMHIVTHDSLPITSKTTYLDANCWIDALGLEGYTDMGSQQAPIALQIRGRGNSTWTDVDKKPYRLKFDKKQSPLGMTSNKHFALMAIALDGAAFRDAAAFELSNLLGLSWAPATQPVEVVLNGDYIGLYFITETIRVDKKRVNITEQADNDTIPEHIAGGWLIELDNYASDPHVTLHSRRGRNAIFTYKSPEELSPAQELWLTEQLDTIDSLITQPHRSGLPWGRMLDATDMARFYVLQEALDNFEAFSGSCYMWHDSASKGDPTWHMGPVWDFGNSLARNSPDFIYNIADTMHYKTLWIKDLVAYSQFNKLVHDCWKQFFVNDLPGFTQHLIELSDKIAAARYSDWRRWNSTWWTQQLGESQWLNRFLRKCHFLNQQWTQAPTQPDLLTHYTIYYDNSDTQWEHPTAFVRNLDELVPVTVPYPGAEMQPTGQSGIYRLDFTADSTVCEMDVVFSHADADPHDHWGTDSLAAHFYVVNHAIYKADRIAGLDWDGVYSGGSGIAMPVSTLQVSVSGRTITANHEIAVCDLQGRRMGKPGLTVTVSSPGIYVAVSALGTAKVAVR